MARHRRLYNSHPKTKKAIIAVNKAWDVEWSLEYIVWRWFVLTFLIFHITLGFILILRKYMSRKRRNQDPEKIEKKKAIAIEQADRVERRNLYWSPRFILYRWIFLTLTFIQLGLLIKALMRKYITGAG